MPRGRPPKPIERLAATQRRPGVKADGRARILLRVSCEVCGEPTISKYGVCVRTRKCQAARARRKRGHDIVSGAPCNVCGELTTSKLRICGRTPQCIKARTRVRYATDQNFRSLLETKRQERKVNHAARRDALSEQQNGLCPCGQPLGEKVHLDHDHKCCGDRQARESCGQCDRAAMHGQCNSIIGLAAEDPARLRNLADYLEKVNPNRF